MAAEAIYSGLWDAAPAVQARELTAQADVFDWTAPLPRAAAGAFGVVLLCDVLYQPRFVPAVAAAAAHLLADGCAA